MNRATRINVALLGVIFGISGINHGLFETLQGNIPTGGRFISAIGETQKMWPHGNEPAFTLIPNFLITGIAAMLVGLTVIIWSCGYVHKKKGPIILLLLFILLLLVGGGMAQVLFFPWIYIVSRQINKPLVFWERFFDGKQALPGKLWPWFLGLGTVLLLIVLAIATTGFLPGVNNPEIVITIMLGCLAAEVILLPLTFIFGFAHDIKSGGRFLMGNANL
ncbi:MAG: hypothetical protein IT308_02775 [Anaerolineaceae bacterium]|nr:hypothetical protein [Anaerolineaceae bacterium]